MSTELPKYQPYVRDDREHSNDLKENRGAGSAQPYIPNGWAPGLDKTTEGGE